MTKLKPCPFCGNPEIYLSGSDNLPPDKYPYWYVLCSECGGSVFGNADPEVAAEAWNRRANDVRPVAYCRDCRWFYDGFDIKCCANHKGLVITDENGFCHHAKPKNGGADG